MTFKRDIQLELDWRPGLEIGRTRARLAPDGAYTRHGVRYGDRAHA